MMSKLAAATVATLIPRFSLFSYDVRAGPYNVVTNEWLRKHLGQWHSTLA